MYMDNTFRLLFGFWKICVQHFSTKLRGFQAVNVFLVEFLKIEILIPLGRKLPTFFYPKIKNRKHKAILWLFMQSLFFLMFFVFEKVGSFPPKMLWFVRATNKNVPIPYGTCQYSILTNSRGKNKKCYNLPSCILI